MNVRSNQQDTTPVDLPDYTFDVEILDHIVRGPTKNFEAHSISSSNSLYPPSTPLSQPEEEKHQFHDAIETTSQYEDVTKRLPHFTDSINFNSSVINQQEIANSPAAVDRHDYSSELDENEDEISLPSREYTAYSLSSESAPSTPRNSHKIREQKQQPEVPFFLSFKGSPMEQTSKAWRDPERPFDKIQQIRNIGSFGWPQDEEKQGLNEAEDWTDLQNSSNNDQEVLVAIDLDTSSSEQPYSEKGHENQTSCSVDETRSGNVIPFNPREGPRTSMTLSEASNAMRSLSTHLFRPYTTSGDHQTPRSSSTEQERSDEQRRPSVQKSEIKHKCIKQKENSELMNRLILRNLSNIKELYTRIESMLINTQDILIEIRENIREMRQQGDGQGAESGVIVNVHDKSKEPFLKAGDQSKCVIKDTKILNKIAVNGVADISETASGTPFNSPQDSMAKDDIIKAAHHVAVLKELSACRSRSLAMEEESYCTDVPTPVRNLKTLSWKNMEEARSDVNEKPRKQMSIVRKAQEWKLKEQEKALTELLKKMHFDKPDSGSSQQKELVSAFSEGELVVVQVADKREKVQKKTIDVGERQICITSPSTRAIDITALPPSEQPVCPESLHQVIPSEEKFPPHTSVFAKPCNKVSDLQESDVTKTKISSPVSITTLHDSKKGLISSCSELHKKAKEPDDFAKRQAFLLTATSKDISEAFSHSQIVSVVKSNLFRPTRIAL